MSARVSKVVIPVDDQSAALAFWTKRLGFELVTDAPYADERWLEVRAPDRGMTLVLPLRDEWEPRRATPPQLPTSPVMFDCDDIQETYSVMSAKGVRFPQPPVEQPFGWWALFEDEQGERYALSQREPDE